MRSLFFALSLSLLFAFPDSAKAHQELVFQNPPRWEKLGQGRVNYGLDRDEIVVTAREGAFTALKIRAELAPINLHRVVVHFANGDTQEMQIRSNIRAGQSTRVLNLAGNRRIINKVTFWYDTKNRAARRGRVELWGRH